MVIMNVGIDSTTARELNRGRRRAVSKIKNTLLDYDFTLFVDEVIREFRFEEEDLSEDLPRKLTISLGFQRAKDITGSICSGVSVGVRNITSRSLLQHLR